MMSDKGAYFFLFCDLGFKAKEVLLLRRVPQCSQMSWERFQVLPHILGMSLTSCVAYPS
jgi:hypothetical protein